MALVGGVYDNIPSNAYGSKTAIIKIGEADGHQEDADCATTVETTFTIHIFSIAVGKVECRKLMDLVRKAFNQQNLSLSENALIDQRISLYRDFTDSDGATQHGVVAVTFLVEEPA